MNAISGRRIFRVLLLASLLLGFSGGAAHASDGAPSASASGGLCVRTALFGGRTICL
ncbi:MAG TPA: hypothetical protein VHD87_15665 [Acidimicrobiales bacterium]|nr:hypothetical protein [Acidimicrobiales bacterium]